MGSFVSNSVAQPVAGGPTNTGGFGGLGGLSGLVMQLVNSGAIQPVTQPTQKVLKPEYQNGIPLGLPMDSYYMDAPITPTPTAPASLPITTQPVNQVSAPTTPVRGYNQVRDPRLNRMAMRPMFNTSRYDNRISDLLNRLMPQTEKKADGGRIGYADGTPVAGMVYYGPKNNTIANWLGESPDNPNKGIFQVAPTRDTLDTSTTLSSLPITRSNPLMNALRKFNQVRDPRIARLLQQRQNRARGGIMNLKVGGLPAEMDYRASGGFVPIGKKERADDVPARLSKNEFVFTANAVRNAGGGDIRKGAKRMYNLMHQLEAKR